MQLEQFHNSIHCRSGIHCTSCRDRNDGAWRMAMVGQAKFDCPYGIPWGQQKSRGLGDTIAKITDKLGIPKCPGCTKRQPWFNKILPYKD